MEIKTQIKKQRFIEKGHARIIQAAAPLFIRKGFLRTSIREIADAAQISEGLLYKYISSKDDVLFSVYKELHEQLFIA